MNVPNSTGLVVKVNIALPLTLLVVPFTDATSLAVTQRTHRTPPPQPRRPQLRRQYASKKDIVGVIPIHSYHQIAALGLTVQVITLVS